MPQITVLQKEIQIDGQTFYVTYIPTTTSGCWYTIQDTCEVWAAVSIDLDGTVVGWRNPPEEEKRLGIEEAIKKAFDIPQKEATLDY